MRAYGVLVGTPLGVVACLVALRRAISVYGRLGVRRRLPSSRHASLPAVGPLIRAPSWLVAALRAADVKADPAPVVLWWFTAVVVAPTTAWLVGGPMAGFLSLVATVIVPGAALVGGRGRSSARLVAALPDALESTARSLRSGASLGQALDEASTSVRGPLGAELARVGADVERGRSLTQAVEAMGDLHRLPEVDLVVAALCLGHEAGGAHAQALDGLATTVRQRTDLAGEIRALSAQARISALVIGLAPVGFAAFSVVADQDMGRFLLGSSAGRLFLCAGLVLDALGWLWMRHLCRLAP